ncbi:unannotated protein [freshwater metagenome]|uniref:Unannotated protein n=1 Tax=freshwater metagenome TaxID=449393 RepID=A0A6J6S353_9ZZZZ|nr:hypothetical protein [Actinomycetota bacterium]
MPSLRPSKISRIYLVRHGHSTANAKSILAGQDQSVELSELGILQSAEIAKNLHEVKFARIYSSPLTRCLQSVRPLANLQKMTISELPGVIEMNYGDWSGKKLVTLARTKLWKVIQSEPSLVRFPNGESFTQMQDRALEAVRIAAVDGKNILVCSHGDVIKAIIAGTIGLHLDQIQRLVIDPASISIIEITKDSARALTVNDTSHLVKLQSSSKKESKLKLGGGSGSKRS